MRREVARLALEKLIVDGRIHPARIEEMVEKSRREVDQIIKSEGERATFETGIHGIHPELVKILAACATARATARTCCSTRSRWRTSPA